MPRPEPTPEELIEQLNQRFQNGGCVLFVGSGLSAQAGFPTWKNFAEGLVERFGSDTDKVLSREALEIGDTDSVVYNISRDHDSELVPYISEVFGKRVPLPEAHRILAALNFQGAITANWDNLLEETYPNAPVLFPDSAEQLQSHLLKRRFFILKIYGDPDSSKSLILSAPDFERRVANNSPFVSFMYSLLLQQTVVFVGCSLEGIDSFLRGLRFYQPSGQHFAFSGVRGAAWQTRARVLEDKYKVLTIPYYHPRELMALLRRLKGKPVETRSAGRGEAQTLRSHSAAVNSIAISHDGFFAVSGSDDRTINIWNLASGELTRTLTGPTSWVGAVAITPDGSTAISGGGEKSLKLWDLNTGRLQREILGHAGPVRSIAVTLDGWFALSGSADHTVRVWDLGDDNRLALTLVGHSDEVLSVAVDKLHSYAVSASADRTLIIWLLPYGEIIHTLVGHSDKVAGVAVTPDGRYVISGSYDRTIGVWDVATGKLLRTMEGHSGTVLAVSVTPDGRRVISGSEDHTVRVWDLASGRLLESFAGHTGGVYSVAVTPNGHQVISASSDTTLRKWEIGVASSRLRRATFENIGPFEGLSIDFDAGWNVLLGNNGAGKSTILRALAIAAVGSDAAPWADQLIRIGEQYASITLQTDRETYRTTLRRKLGGGAEVESIPTRAMDGDGWLVLGFPPLRTGKGGASSPSAEGSPIPVSDDALPLLRGEADPRLDRLKDWVFNLDYRIKDAETRREDTDGLKRLISEFFRIVGRLTEGVRLEFGGVNPSTRQVMVLTDDGTVPIEQVSQGMASLISWVGVLLQRLYEVFGGDDPRKHYALVLMDEIDAHMHPVWQQIMIPRLKEIFPNVQFIATTHSPLIIAGLARQEVLVFRRDGAKVTVTQPTMDFSGWRVDQILTSEAFGLTGARDDSTVRKQKRYGELLNRNVLKAEEQGELEMLRNDPAISARTVEETPRLEAVAEFAREAIAKSSDARSGDLGREAQEYLQKVLSDVGI